VIPSSINVPRLLAIIIRSQYSGSEVSAHLLELLSLAPQGSVDGPEETMPYRGIWLMTKKMMSVTDVHIILCWKGTLVSGIWISGRMGTNGLTVTDQSTRTC
jgi:hypothetical protein